MNAGLFLLALLVSFVLSWGIHAFFRWVRGDDQ